MKENDKVARDKMGDYGGNGSTRLEGNYVDRDMFQRKMMREESGNKH